MESRLEPRFPPQGILQIRLPQGRYICELQNFPVLSFRTYGQLDSDMVRLIYAVRDPICYWAAAHNTKVWAIWDLGHAEAPDAINRKKIAELGQQADAIEGFYNVVILVKNPLLRGAVTATKWLMGDKVPVDIAPTMRAAIAAGRLRYKSENTEPPDISDNYELPEWDDQRPTLEIEPSDIWWSLENRGKQFVDHALKRGG